MSDPPDPYAEKIRHRAIKWAEGVAALGILVAMRACEAALEAIPKADDHVLRHVLFTGLVVSYARAFEDVVHPDVDIRRRFSIRGIVGFDRSLHDALLALRDDQIAHAGHALNDYALTFQVAKLTFGVEQPDGTIKERVERHIVGTRARASIATGVPADEQSAALLAHVRALTQEATGRLAMAIVEHDAASLFRFEQAAAEGTSPTKTLAKKTFRPPPGPGLMVLDEDDLALSLAQAKGDLRLAFALLTFRLEQKGGDLLLNLTIYEVPE
jgi:hypothetical protein